jgi:splicing factor 1
MDSELESFLQWAEGISSSSLPQHEPSNGFTNKNYTQGNGGVARKRRNKWDLDPTPTVVPGFPRVLPSGIPNDQLDALLVRLRIEEITRKLTTGQLEVNNFDDRSPSPEPIYDANGKRVNTREQRAKDKLMKERQKLVAEAMTMNPLFRPPPDYQPPSQKKTKKIYIPLREFPEYNFIGLIIGPRGNTQKRMERETGAKIAIRGKGSLKEGKVNKVQYQDDDALHVLITADTEEQLQLAAEKVRELLVPIEEGKNEHKRQQLRELAEINGTLRDRGWNITQRTWDPANVKCQICGEQSHPTTDCPLKGTGLPPKPKQNIDNEYESFLAEIGEKKPGGDNMDIADAEKSYEEFMNAINEVSSPSSLPASSTQIPPHAPQHSPYGPPPPGQLHPSPYGPPGALRPPPQQHAPPPYYPPPHHSPYGPPPPWGGAPQRQGHPPPPGTHPQHPPMPQHPPNHPSHPGMYGPPPPGAPPGAGRPWPSQQPQSQPQPWAPSYPPPAPWNGQHWGGPPQ